MIAGNFFPLQPDAFQGFQRYFQAPLNSPYFSKRHQIIFPLCICQHIRNYFTGVLIFIKFKFH